MKIRPFAVERWMNAHETHCEYNVAETCVESLTVEHLLDLTGKTQTILQELLPPSSTRGSWSRATAWCRSCPTTSSTTRFRRASAPT